MSPLKRLLFAVALAVGAAGLVGFGAMELSIHGGTPWAVSAFVAAMLLLLLAASEDGPEQEPE